MTDLVAKVMAQTDAYNRKDLDALLEGLAEDYESWEVGPEGPNCRARGRDQVGQALAAMFAASGYANSTVEDVRAYGQLAVAIEVDSFDTADGRKTMRSLGLYEFRGEELLRAWSFPLKE